MAQVNVTVNGRIYRFSCEDGEENHVLGLGTRFEKAISELREGLGEIGDQRLMVMAGILMTDRLDDAEHRLRRVEQEVRDLKEHRLDAASRYDGLEARFVAVLEESAQRIDGLIKSLTRPQVEEGQARHRPVEEAA
jgi:cell division protein ZapA